MLSSDDELQKLRDGLFVSDHPQLRACLKPVETERYIGIDQGLKTFSMVAVDRRRDSLPRVVAAVQVNLIDCGLFSSSQKINAAEVLLLLREHSPLFQWMRTSDTDIDDESQQLFHLEKTDRVVVLLEQIAVDNKYSQPRSRTTEPIRRCQLVYREDVSATRPSQERTSVQTRFRDRRRLRLETCVLPESSAAFFTKTTSF